ncbi:xylulokinase [Microbacterium sp.]|uniref:xylulokinase n=1 Tax=Microbacterium sp. TaxID=51671 RepID=UPI002620A5D6|nr:xylulokinase [Microbacterium sp.]MCV0334176.1 xylulokinase [Microbacterium sp.]MCV0374296.1 xylulokinase [Microbacterium sp.]MCV0389368.1 xylulokinase [Microbacterium sp.]MCV0418902.1 xylulokinase [Microbacterium sp.]MCV0421208.1 xylulokinase [Microbacterium sp.]
MIIAHDLGTTGNKASLHHDDGRLVASVTVPYPAHFAAGGVAEQDPADWWDAVVAATRDLIARTGTAPTDIAGLVVSGQMMGAVLLDAHGEPARPAIIWADTRAGAQQRELEAAIGAERAYGILGHRLNPTYSVEKVMWVRDNEPDTWARVRRVCVAKDFIVLRLTGRLATDRSDASGTNAYDQAAGTWSDEVLQAARLDPELFPEILESTQIAGTLTDAAADALGLPASVRVVMGGGDGPMAAVGSGVVAPEDGPYVCLGTSSWISFAADAPLHDPAMRTFTFDNVVPGSFVPTATMQAGGASVQWIAEALSPDPAHPETGRLTAEASADVDTDDLYFLPYLLGERSPMWDPEARGAFVGLARHHARAHLVRAVLEGTAFNLLSCIQAFREAGAVIDRIDAVGGGAQSDVYLSVLADVWGVPVRRRTIVEEANSLGAAVTAAVGLGLTDFSAARALSEVTAEFIPDAARHAVYAERHARFADAYTTLAPWFAGRPR